MSSAAYAQPESEQADAVVSVRGDSLRQARAGLVLSLCLIAALAALHPDWKTLGTLAVVQSVGTVYAAVRAVLQFRTRLDEAEPLPTRAVEAFGRPKPPPLGWRQRLSSWALLIAGIAGAVASLWTHWARDLMAAAIALLIADDSSARSRPRIWLDGGSGLTAACSGRSCATRTTRRRSTSPTGPFPPHSGGRGRS